MNMNFVTLFFVLSLSWIWLCMPLVLLCDFSKGSFCGKAELIIIYLSIYFSRDMRSVCVWLQWVNKKTASICSHLFCCCCCDPLENIIWCVTTTTAQKREARLIMHTIFIIWMCLHLAQKDEKNNKRLAMFINGSLFRIECCTKTIFF